MIYLAKGAIFYRQGGLNRHLSLNAMSEEVKEVKEEVAEEVKEEAAPVEEAAEAPAEEAAV